MPMAEILGIEIVYLCQTAGSIIAGSVFAGSGNCWEQELLEVKNCWERKLLEAETAGSKNCWKQKLLEAETTESRNC
jgi:hypothetical protein